MSAAPDLITGCAAARPTTASSGSGGAGTATAIAAVVLYRIITFGFVIGAGRITWLVLRRPALLEPGRRWGIRAGGR